jgi:hypothetical protein
VLILLLVFLWFFILKSGRLWALSCWGGIVFMFACIIMALTKPEDNE